jgi:hypothetical protein
MQVAVFGPRDHNKTIYSNYAHVCHILDEYQGVSKVWSGGGTGVEQLALRYAEENGIPHEIIPPRLKQFPSAAEAFRHRNCQLIGRAELIVLLWDARSDFYVELMAEAIRQGKRVNLYPME